ncbi:MAG: ABC transporter ATP-binding protein/permease [Desulfovibrio sp.]|nr:ABC transporter ATP-binding protein/permease [Desulfovibrio sp.]MBR5050842.1 ABC transporter ATP-binding protein/permease [Desulfovibrio sp.]
MADTKTSTWKAFWHLFKGFWRSAHRWPALGMLAFTLACCSVKAYVFGELITWAKKISRLVSSTEAADLVQLPAYIQEGLGLVALTVLLASAVLFVQQSLRLRWRVWMTERFLTRWMSDKAYYRLQAAGLDADNPDQRISEDAGFFAEKVLDLVVGFWDKMSVAVVALLAIMAGSSGDPVKIGPFLGLGPVSLTTSQLFCLGCLCFYVPGTWLAHLAGRRLISLKYEQKQREADFRFSMMRTRENSESIAFYGGEQMELQGSRRRFAGVVENFKALIARKTLLKSYTAFFDKMADFLPYLMLLLLILCGKSVPDNFIGLILSCAAIKDFFSFFVNSYETLADLAAIVRRLASLDRSMDEARALPGGASLAEGVPGRFETKDLCVQLPNGRSVMQNLSLALERGARLLVTGPSGCGKSTFLRTVSGIWPFGSGKVCKAPEERTLFLPQRPYLPLGTLRGALCYPSKPLPASEDGRLKEVLRKVDLERLVPLLDQEDDWSRILSLGEQQRIAFARVLLARPDWVFLDESTSALDEERERGMYQLIASELPQTGLVSVGHRTTLLALHDRQLALEDGAWSLRPLACQPAAAPA